MFYLSIFLSCLHRNMKKINYSSCIILVISLATNQAKAGPLDKFIGMCGGLLSGKGKKETKLIESSTALKVANQLGFEFDMMQMSFFISRERIISTVGDGMAPWREKLFISMQRNTSPVSDFYQIPPNRVVELGSQIEI